MNTYEVWRYFGYNRKTDVYEHQELIGRDRNTGSAMFLLGRLTGIRRLTPNSPVDFSGRRWGMEFVDVWGNIEYWCVIEK